ANAPLFLNPEGFILTLEVVFLVGMGRILPNFLRLSRINYVVFVRLLLYQPNMINISHIDQTFSNFDWKFLSKTI
ncbi:hypothetical protein, partial [Enterovibrio norvegicus]|uniref:hypothetical protein n=2 Tax=Enterovibrio norvegicus TaxID=188144 RepID=UPI001A7E1A89